MGGKNVDLRGKRTELCVPAAKSCSHMTRKDSKMPLRKTFCLYSATVAARNSCHVKLWPRKNVERGMKLVERFGSSVKMGRTIFAISLSASFPLLSFSISAPQSLVFPPYGLVFRNALNVLIFAHANMRVSQQQRRNSSTDLRQTDRTTCRYLARLRTPSESYR